MKTYTTQGQTVEILDAKIVRASGYGQYSILIDIECNGSKTLKVHSTDSRLFDDATDEDIAVDGHSAYVMENAKYTIESAIDDYAAEL
jgi:hypothetical protein